MKPVVTIIGIVSLIIFGVALFFFSPLENLKGKPKNIQPAPIQQEMKSVEKSTNGIDVDSILLLNEDLLLTEIPVTPELEPIEKENILDTFFKYGEKAVGLTAAAIGAYAALKPLVARKRKKSKA